MASELEVIANQVEGDIENGRFEKAIQTLTNIVNQHQHPLWYYRRSQAFLKTGQAQRAFEDADASYKLEKSAQACLAKGNALLKLENFDMALASFEEGKYLLQNTPNQDIWNQLQRGSVCANLLRNAAKSLGNEIENEFECVLCLKLFYEPATLPCGHTFCRHCIGQSTLFNNKCPLCRTVFHSNFKPPVTVSLKNILEKLFPEEYKTRAQEVKEQENEESMRLPLFIMGGICFPGEDFPMHVYDPRYRIMLKRVMQGCRQFGLVQVQEDSNNPEGYTIFNVGCCMEIQQCETLPDGRSLIQTKAVKRFRIIERSMVDGYWVAKVEFLNEELPSDERELKVTQDLIKRIKYLVSQAIIKNDGQQDLSQLEQLAASMDYSLDSPEACFLLSSKICTLLPISPQLKQPLLEMNSPIDRLRRIISLLERLVGSPNCALL